MIMSNAALSAFLADADDSTALRVWKDILGVTPPRLEVDFASHFQGGVTVDTTSVVINSANRSNIQGFCEVNNISTHAFVLGTLHHTLRAHNHQPFAIGVYHHHQDSDNILLVPFEGNTSGQTESLQALHGRWTNRILPYSHTPYNDVKGLGYGCNVTLSVNGKNSANQVSPIGADINLHVSWMENITGDGSITISFESGIGPWPGIKERFQQIRRIQLLRMLHLWT